MAAPAGVGRWFGGGTAEGGPGPPLCQELSGQALGAKPILVRHIRRPAAILSQSLADRTRGGLPELVPQCLRLVGQVQKGFGLRTVEPVGEWAVGGDREERRLPAFG